MLGTKVSLRLRMSSHDAHYAGELVDGARMLALFGDLATELLIRLDGDEGLFRAYDTVEFLAPVFAGDYIEASAELTRVGASSRSMRFEARKVISNMRAPGQPASAADVLAGPVVVCRATGTCVTPKSLQRRPKELYLPGLPAGPEPGFDVIAPPAPLPELVLTAAIVGAEITRAQTPHLPITAREIADEAARCREAGAAVIHLHVRNDDGTPTQSRERFAEAIDAIRAKTDCVVQTSTGGAVGMSIVERAQPLACRPEMATLNCGSINFGDDVFVNTRPQIRELAKWLRDAGSVPELECYDVGHVEEALALAREGAIVAPLHFQFVLGIPGGIGASEGHVTYLRSLLPAGATWGVAAVGRHQQPMTELAMRSGGHARVGLEDNIYMSKGVLAEGSAPLVARAAAYARSIGRVPVDPANARRLLGLALALVALALSLSPAACADTTPPPQAPSADVAPSPSNPPAAPPRATATPLVSAVPVSGLPHPFGVADMLSFERISEPVVSQDGKLVAFTVGTPDLAANKQTKDIWLAATDGSFTRRLTTHPAADSDPHFAPDGKSLTFVSSRSGSAQVWRIGVDGGEASQVTDLPVDVGAVVPFSDGKRLLLALDVYPDAATLDETAKRKHAIEASKENVRAYDDLPVRHWDTWDDGTRTHLFVFSDASHEPVDLLKKLPYDAPTKPFGDMKEVAISHDGSEVVFTSKMVGKKDAWSTNSDLWVVPSDGSAAPRSLTAKNLATDTTPVFSHDGSRLAYLAMARPGYESDRLHIVVLDWKTKAESKVAEGWDRSPHDLVWSADDRSLLATADDTGRCPLVSIDVASGKVTTLVGAGTSSDVTVAGDRVVFSHDDLQHPAEIWTLDGAGHAGPPRAVTHLNDAKVAAIRWGQSEQFSFVGAKGDKVYGWLVKPPDLPAGGRAPVAFLIHGGPQGSFDDHFHYRWNAEAFAGDGYATLMIDFHGSTGYGQAFTDAIRDDWGGAPFEDLMKGLDAALVKYPFLDKDRMAALGASYGGYMINWINGKTDRFKALVCHDGNLDETMAYYDTEELWFPEWEHKGVPWENPAGYARHTPMSLVKNWKTPTLVVHGGKDYRVVDTQGLATFTALQRRGIPSRLLYFPEENHWVLKPAHSKRWHDEVLGWIDRFTK